MLVDLKTVAAQINSTGTIETESRVAIKYCTMKGKIRFMQISKRKPEITKGDSKGGKLKASPNMKKNALIPIIDHTDNDKPKDIFLFGILAFNPSGSFSHFYPVKRDL